MPAAAWAPPTADLRADWRGRFVLGRVPAGRCYRIGGLTPGRASLWIMGRMCGYAEPPEETTMVVGGATTENVDTTLFAIDG
ncbi:MAG: hypothetical protein ACE5JM_00270 [Armatimonadota bacterium]